MKRVKKCLFALATIVIAMILVNSHLQAGFPCGDADNNGGVSIADAFWLIDYLYAGGYGPTGDCDVDECWSVNLSDITYICEYLYSGGPKPCEGSVTCYLPNDNCSIVIDCPYEVIAQEVDSIAVPVYINTDMSLLGLAVGFTPNSNIIEINSIDTTGTVIPNNFTIYTFQSDPVGAIQIAAIAMTSDTQPMLPQNNGLLFKLWITIPPQAPSQVINIDTISITTAPIPDGTNVFAVAGGGSIRPRYFDCGEADLTIIGRDYTCGDANGDGTLNIVDAVYVIRYVFSGGNPPEPMASGDMNCDDSVDISDAVYMINYVFIGGKTPCDINGDSVLDC